ncbi:MAG: hypothetical protein EUB_01836 [Eubacterium sp.]
MREKLKNNCGSALIWVLVICVIFGLLGMAIGSIALSMNNRSINNNLKQQAYFTARSAVDAVFEQLNGDAKNPVNGNLTKYLDENLLAEDKHHIEIEDMGFEESMGKCFLTGDYDSKTGIVTLTAIAQKGDQNNEVTLTAKLEKKTTQAEWPGKEGAISLVDKDTEKINKKKLGKEDSTSVYYAEHSNTKDDEDGGDIKINNKSGPIFIYVKSNVTLRVEDIEGESGHNVDIFFYLEPGARLILEGDSQSKPNEYNVYIFGPDATLEVYGKKDNEDYIKIIGGLNVQFVYPEKNVAIVNKKPVDDQYSTIFDQIVNNSDSSTPELWTKIQYTTNE